MLYHFKDKWNFLPSSYCLLLPYLSLLVYLSINLQPYIYAQKFFSYSALRDLPYMLYPFPYYRHEPS